MSLHATAEDVGVVAAWVAGFCALPAAFYWHYERRGRAAWPPPPPAPESLVFEGYRRARPPVAPRPKAPAFVRVTAFTCLAFGQMFLPGLVAGMFGMLMGGAGVVSIPGLWVAAAEVALGRALLLGRPGVADQARTLAQTSGALNGLLAVACAIGLIGGGPSTRRTSAAVGAYVLASLAQAALLFWASRRLAREPQGAAAAWARRG